MHNAAVGGRLVAMTCDACGKPIRVLSGVCSSCGHTVDPIEFKTQLVGWACAVANPPDLHDDPDADVFDEDEEVFVVTAEPEPELIEPEPEAVVESAKPKPAKRAAKKSAKAKD